MRAVLTGLVLTAAQAFACPTCACGNPALTTMGNEQPRPNRVRLAMSARAWQQTTSERLRELRFDVTGSWAPTEWLSLAVSLPVQLRELEDASLARERGAGPGDIELMARAVVLGARSMRPPALVSVVLGARLPTAPTLIDRQQRPLSLDAQLSAGAFAPMLGVTWSGFFGERWSGHASLSGELPLVGRFGFRPAPVLSSSLLGQFQPLKWLAVRAGLEGRLEGESALEGVMSSKLAGFLGQAALDVLFSPTSRVVFGVGMRVPVLDLRNGPVRVLPIIVGTVVVDA